MMLNLELKFKVVALENEETSNKIENYLSITVAEMEH